MKVKNFFRASRGRIATTHTAFASGRTTQKMLPTGLDLHNNYGHTFMIQLFPSPMYSLLPYVVLDLDMLNQDHPLANSAESLGHVIW